MAKIEKEQSKSVKAYLTEKDIIPQKYQHLVAAAIIYLSILVFFHEVIFEGKTYESADTIASHSWDTIYKDAEAQGITPLWNPYIFCGMPGYASLTFAIERTFDLTIYFYNKIRSVFDYVLFFGHPSSWILIYYLIYGIGVYLFTFYKIKNKPVALVVSLMATYATYVALLIMMGHITKLAVLAFFPYVFLIVEKLREKFDLLQAILLAVVIHLMVESPHVQFIFYVFFALGIFFLFLLIRWLLKKETLKPIIQSGLTLTVAAIFAFLMSADKYLSPLEYNPYSIRGTNPIVHTTPTQQTKTIEGGLDYDYATSWSFSPGEIMTFFVPSWYGFGWHPYKGPLTRNQETRLNTYWGPQPFVDGPQYMGVIVVILAIIGFYRNRKEPFVQYMGITIVISMLIAFGKEFSLVYDLMYNYFPMFNKFRIPLMILMLVQFFTPILAGYGIMSLIADKKKNISPDQAKRWKYILSALLVGTFAALIGKGAIKGVFTTFFPVQEVGKVLERSYGQLNPAVLELVYDFVFASVATDILIGFILLTVMFAAFYYFQKGKLQSTTLYGALIFVVLFDLWRVAWKPSDPKIQQESFLNLTTPNFVKAIQQDTTNYRVLKMINGQPVYDNSLAIWRLQNAYGYHGAKLRIYQDMVDVAGMGNPLVWQMMNIKYLITNREETNESLVQVYNGPDMKIYAFRYWLPRVFFVNRYEVSDGLSTLNKIAAMSFDPRDIAYIAEDINEKIDPPLKGAEAEIVHYGIQDLEVRVTATGNNLLFLSEAYYPKGWKAFIDGKETEILRLNYLFRGVIIPPGAHTLTMKFEPEIFILGKRLSLVSNLLVIAGFVFLVVIRLKKKRTANNLS